ncbi:hypothetical protein GGR55DRAFT_534959 [Xylaria sp. FL0064]|nr:hypothetical protein GGR55DRAFT_534959 [Xylaria sp. FL0064]
MACPTSTHAHKQLEGVPNAPPDSTTHRRYSHLLTYSPATFRDLPTELRWIIWDVMIDQTALQWSCSPKLLVDRFKPKELSAEKHYENRVVPFLILSQLNKGSRLWVLKRFQIVIVRPGRGFNSLHYSPSCIHMLGGPMRCVFGIKVDALLMCRLDGINRQLHDKYLFPSWPTTVENVVIDISSLEEFLDFGVHEFSSLKRIYLDMTELDRPPLFFDEPPEPPRTPETPLPQFLSRRNDNKLVAEIAGQRPTIYRRTLVWIDEVEGAKRISQVMAIPRWSKPMSALWLALERHRYTCVFVFNATGVDNYRSEIHVFPASRRPEALEQEDYSEQQE